MTRPFKLVDVFGTDAFTGNPLAVIADAEGLATEEMQRITRWLNLSETTFLLPPTHADADYRVRIFTLAHELPFAGHPTLGTCHAWLEAGGRPKREGVVVQECGAGLIAVRQADKGLAFAAPPLIRDGQPTEAEIAEMRSYVQEALDAGAIGVSTGTFYPPAEAAPVRRRAERRRCRRPGPTGRLARSGAPAPCRPAPRSDPRSCCARPRRRPARACAAGPCSSAAPWRW